MAVVHGVAKSWTLLSDFTLTFHFHALEKEMATHSCSCLENPRDGGAWWAAVCGVAESDTTEATEQQQLPFSWNVCMKAGAPVATLGQETMRFSEKVLIK